MTVFQRYLLLQIPGWLLAGVILVALEARFGLPRWVVFAVLGVLILKDLVLYPYLRRSYEPRVASGAEALVGQTGLARQRLDPAGYVELRGELWLAEAIPDSRPIAAGERVCVVAAEGLRLLVRRQGASVGS